MRSRPGMISARSARHSPARSSGPVAPALGVALEAGLATAAPEGDAPLDGAAPGVVEQEAMVTAASPIAARVVARPDRCRVWIGMAEILRARSNSGKAVPRAGPGSADMIGRMHEQRAKVERQLPPGLRLIELPEVAAAAPMDVGERFRDLPGLALLESARPGRNARWSYLTADPVAVLETPAEGSDPFASARRLLRRVTSDALGDPEAPPFLGGLAGFLGYDLGRRFERLPSIAAGDQELPTLRLALHDWVIAWDRRDGRAWLGGRAVDERIELLDRRLAEVRERALRPAPVAAIDAGRPAGIELRSGLDRAAYEARVESIRGSIAHGDIYQANLTRRLEAPFRGDPWPLYRRLRTGDPALFAAYVDLEASPLTGARRAIV